MSQLSGVPGVECGGPWLAYAASWPVLAALPVLCSACGAVENASCNFVALCRLVGWWCLRSLLLARPVVVVGFLSCLVLLGLSAPGQWVLRDDAGSRGWCQRGDYADRGRWSSDGPALFGGRLGRDVEAAVGVEPPLGDGWEGLESRVRVRGAGWRVRCAGLVGGWWATGGEALCWVGGG
jgi:hypothetical protein